MFPDFQKIIECVHFIFFNKKGWKRVNGFGTLTVELTINTKKGYQFHPFGIMLVYAWIVFCLLEFIKIESHILSAI